MVLGRIQVGDVRTLSDLCSAWEWVSLKTVAVSARREGGSLVARKVREFQLECSSPVQRNQAELRAQLGKAILSQTEEVGTAEMDVSSPPGWSLSFCLSVHQKDS